MKTWLASALIAVAGPAFAAEPQAEATPEVAGANLSSEFAHLMATRAEPRLADLQKVKVLFVNGFMNDWLSQQSGAFDDQRATLRARGLVEGVDYALLREADGYDGLGRIVDGAAAVARAIRASRRPVVIVSQSKGGATTLQALLEYPELQPRVRGWFSIQGAFAGSPVADGVMASGDVGLVENALRFIGGDAGAVAELTRPLRASYLNKNAREVAALLRTTHVVSLATSIAPAQLGWQLKQMDNRWCGACAREANDGLIATANEILPGSSWALVAGLSHSDTTTTANAAVNRVTLTNALLAMILGM